MINTHLKKIPTFKEKTKLVVFGDSFADHYAVINDPNTWWHFKGWPGIVGFHIDPRTEPFFAGRSGTSVWFSYKNFVHALEHTEFEYVAFVYTAAQRIMSLPVERAGEAWEIVNYRDGEYVSPMVKSYVENFWDEELHDFITQQVFRKVNLLCKKHNKKLVNIVPFENSFRLNEIDYNDALFPCLIGLDSVTRAECGNAERYIETSQTWINGADQRMNHMNEQNNKVVAQKIYELFQDQSVQTVRAMDLPGLDFSEETWLTYNTLSLHNTEEELCVNY